MLKKGFVCSRPAKSRSHLKNGTTCSESIRVCVNTDETSTQLVAKDRQNSQIERNNATVAYGLSVVKCMSVGRLHCDADTGRQVGSCALIPAAVVERLMKAKPKVRRVLCALGYADVADDAIAEAYLNAVQKAARSSTFFVRDADAFLWAFALGFARGHRRSKQFQAFSDDQGPPGEFGDKYSAALWSESLCEGQEDATAELADAEEIKEHWRSQVRDALLQLGAEQLALVAASAKEPAGGSAQSLEPEVDDGRSEATLLELVTSPRGPTVSSTTRRKRLSRARQSAKRELARRGIRHAFPVDLRERRVTRSSKRNGRRTTSPAPRPPRPFSPSLKQRRTRRGGSDGEGS